LALQGHGEWEEDLQVLNKSDVQALNEQELSMQEKDEIRAVWHQAALRWTRRC